MQIDNYAFFQWLFWITIESLFISQRRMRGDLTFIRNLKEILYSKR